MTYTETKDFLGVDNNIVEESKELGEVQSNISNLKHEIHEQEFHDILDYSEDDIGVKLKNLILSDVLEKITIDDELHGKDIGVILSDIYGKIKQEQDPNQRKAKNDAFQKILFCSGFVKDTTSSFDTLNPTEKLKLVSLYNSFSSNPPIFSKGGLGERIKSSIYGKKTDTWQDRYEYWQIFCLDQINETFQGLQQGGIKSYLDTLKIKDPSITDAHIDEYIQNLEGLKKFVAMRKGGEANMGYIIAIVIGIGIGIFAKTKYDEFMKPNIQRGLPIGKLELMDPKVLALITTAKQEFRQAGERTDKQFADESDDNELTRMGKDILNTMQSRTIQMNMEGNIQVSFDFQNYTMHFDGKRIKVVIGSPEYTIADKNTYIMSRNSEWIESNALNQTEQELDTELQEKAKTEAKQSGAVEILAKQQLSTMLLHIYKIVDPKVEGVDIILQGQQDTNQSVKE